MMVKEYLDILRQGNIVTLQTLWHNKTPSNIIGIENYDLTGDTILTPDGVHSHIIDAIIPTRLSHSEYRKIGRFMSLKSIERKP